MFPHRDSEFELAWNIHKEVSQVTPSWLQEEKRNFTSIFLCRPYQSLRAFNFGSICSYFHPDSCFVTSPPSQSPAAGNVVSQGFSVSGSQTITVFNLRVKQEGPRLWALYFCSVLLVEDVLPHFSLDSIVCESLNASLPKSIAGNKIRRKNFRITSEKMWNSITCTTFM